MGKTESGAIWLDETKTSPYEFYQYWFNTDDRDVEKFLLLFSLVPVAEIKQYAQHEGSNLQQAKELLAFEVHRARRPARRRVRRGGSICLIHEKKGRGRQTASGSKRENRHQTEGRAHAFRQGSKRAKEWNRKAFRVEKDRSLTSGIKARYSDQNYGQLKRGPNHEDIISVGSKNEAQ